MNLTKSTKSFTQTRRGRRKKEMSENADRIRGKNSITKRFRSMIAFPFKMFFFENTAERHNVFMWCIDKFLMEAEQQMAKRGYKLHARMIWDKENGVAPAFTVRFSHEYLLWFYKPGKMLMPRKETRGKYTTVLRESATYHSHKPQCAYEMLEDMFPTAKKIELFARNHREGWDAFGNQIEDNA